MSSRCPTLSSLLASCPSKVTHSLQAASALAAEACRVCSSQTRSASRSASFLYKDCSSMCPLCLSAAARISSSSQWARASCNSALQAFSCLCCSSSSRATSRPADPAASSSLASWPAAVSAAASSGAKAADAADSARSVLHVASARSRAAASSLPTSSAARSSRAWLSTSSSRPVTRPFSPWWADAQCISCSSAVLHAASHSMENLACASCVACCSRFPASESASC
mmetsp:Transcript_11425/g.33469  ORF Transcript_11425/g.33469 Transcript_11425/m.33469 type:complete len:226 (+) Transcript_11425:641-1318(+)